MQQAIDILEKIRNKVILRWGPNDTDATRLAELSLLSEIMKEFKSRGDGWIPVTPESMPCDDEEYNICTSDGLVTSVAWSTYLGSFIVGTEKWNSDYLGKITHWQPLPLPPQ